MKVNRKTQIESSCSAHTFGLVLSTLGRQGSVSVLDNIIKMLIKTNKDYVITLMSEIFPQKLKLFSNVDR
jgi:2-(3-amino-3-carboxypropyl)histidine synthase